MNPARRHRLFPLLLSILLAGLPGLLPGTMPRALAAGQASVVVTASPDVIFADGKSSTVLSAAVRDASGANAPDGTEVDFDSTAGQLPQASATTQGGVARVRLISDANDGVAEVTVVAQFASAGGARGTAKVTFTTDRDAVYAGADARWMQIDCPEYLIYSADSRVIEADGRAGSVRFRYKALSLTADALQLDLRTQVLLARNAVLKRGKHTLVAPHLRYDLNSDTGTAVATDSAHVGQTVDIAGLNLATTPQPYYEAEYSTDTDIYKFRDLFTSRVVVAARSIAVDPGRTLQFRRATIYADGRKAMSLPLHVMPLDSDQLFGRQLIGFGSAGLALDVPIYYHVDPSSTGTLFIRNSVVGTGDGSGPIDSTGTRPGLAIDLQHTYSLGLNGSGQFLLNGLTRRDWGAHWNHTQRLDDATRGYFLMDSPDHRSIYGSSDLTRQFKQFSLNMTASGSNNPSQNGYSSSSVSLNSFIQTDPHPIGHGILNYVTTLGLVTGQYSQSTPGTASQVTPVSTTTLDLRLFTAPLHLAAQTTLNNGLTIGESWGSGRTTPTMLLNLGLNRQAPMNGNLSLNYTWRYDPLFSQLGADPTSFLGTYYHSSSQQRLTLNYSVQPSRRAAFNVTSGYGLPLGDTNLYTSVAYRLTPLWGLGAGYFFDRYLGSSYREAQLSVSRRIFNRDLTLTYSTLTKRFRFDFLGTSF